MARHLLKEGPDARTSIRSRANRHHNMPNDIIVSRKDVREALVRTALKDGSFRESLVANPKLAVERALGTKLPEYMEVVVLQDTDEKCSLSSRCNCHLRPATLAMPNSKK